MSYDEMSPIYPYTNEEKTEIRRELGLKESTIEEDVDAILDWFEKQPHLVEAGIERTFIERMLIIAKGSREKTKRNIDNYYKYRYFAPELIQNREKVLSDSQDLWRSYFQFALPKLYKGFRISLVKFIDPDPNLFSSENFLTNTFMLSDIRVQCDYFIGDIWILDMKHLSFGHFVRLNPILIQKSGNLFHEGLKIKIQAMHLINATSFLQPVVNFLRTAFSQKILDRLMFHDSLEDLHKHIPKKYLPKDYGGEEPSTLEFKDMYEKELRTTKTKQFLINSSKYVSDETKRPDSDINEEYLAGTFKKLDLD